MSEELKAIVEVIGNLGEEGVKAFIWYLSVRLLETVLVSASILLGLALTTKFLRVLIGSLTGLERLSRMMEATKYNDSKPNWSDAIQRAIDSRFWEEK